MYVDLHVHTNYSLLDGLIRPKELMIKVKSLGRDSVACTDHGSVAGLVEFWKEARKADIKPLLGAEFYHEKNNENCHLILLAKNREGYNNLIKLNNLSQSNIYKKPRINDDMIRSNGKGLILLTACIQGYLAKSVINGNPDFDWFLNISKYVDHSFLEIQNHGIAAEDIVCTEYLKFGYPVVATVDAHFLEKDHGRAHNVGLAISMNKKEGEFKFNGTGYYICDENDIRLPKDAIERTHEVANLVKNYDIGHDQWVLPKVSYVVDAEFAELEFRLDDYLFNKDLDEKIYRDRLKYEFKIIHENGFLPYFKIVADICEFIDAQGKLRGWGRGSAAGSLVAFLYKITKIDPIKYGLFFERFLNPDRISPPDIDLDFQPEDRMLVIGYLQRKYGNVYQIGTYTTLGSKEVILSCSKAMGIHTRLAEFIPVEAPVPSISELVKKDSFWKQVKAEDNEEFIKICIILEGLPKNRSVHASGVVIDVTGEIPYYISKSGINAGLPITSYDMYSLDDIKFTKIDILGVNMLSIIDRACKAANIKVEDILLNDEKTFKSFNDGNNLGVFQFDGHFFTKIIKDLHPDTFDELVDLNTLGRPGCLESGQTEEYIDRKFGRKERKPIHPKLIDDGHQGLPLFQEQMMKISRDLAGFTMSEADTLRKAIGKKQKDLMDSLMIKFLDGCENNGVLRKDAQDIWDVIEKSARYTWNLSHAVAYTLISYWTMYLSANYPAEFFCELINGADDHTRRRVLLSECFRRKIPVKHALINVAQENPVAVNGEIILGLSGIKFVGESAILAILKARVMGNFLSSNDLKNRTRINSRSLNYLLKAGAFPNEYIPTRDDELESIGYSISGRAIDQGHLKYIEEIGEIIEVKNTTTKKGKPMSFLTVEFHDNIRSVVVFSNFYEQYKDLFKKGAVFGFILDGDVMQGVYNPYDLDKLYVEIPSDKVDEFLSFYGSCKSLPNIKSAGYDVASIKLTEELISFIEKEFGIISMGNLFGHY